MPQPTFEMVHSSQHDKSCVCLSFAWVTPVVPREGLALMPTSAPGLLPKNHDWQLSHLHQWSQKTMRLSALGNANMKNSMTGLGPSNNNATNNCATPWTTQATRVSRFKHNALPSLTPAHPSFQNFATQLFNYEQQKSKSFIWMQMWQSSSPFFQSQNYCHIHLCTVMLFHCDLDLAAIQKLTGSMRALTRTQKLFCSK